MTDNPERDAEILRRWDEKQSSGEIGKALHVTRNVVVGVVCRAGKQRGESNNSTEAKREAARQAGKIRLARPRKEGTKPNRVITFRAQKARQREHAAAQAHAIEAAGTPPEPAPIGQRCTILDLTPSKCHWPIGDPREADFSYCGGKAIQGLSYCGYHCRVAYQPR